ncbi:MAG: 3-deoxy-manno-octulosonate cytidylyltransferase [Patescibacteria group bacterium]
MNIIAIIPARMGSTRFPGKPLAKINGIPMVGHVYFRSKMSKILSDVYVATCDKVIADYVTSIGGKVIMTKNAHKRASDRVAEAAQKIEQETKKKADIIVMVQGDEPMIVPEMINASLRPLIKDPSLRVVNLMSKIHNVENHNDRNEIKVVVDKENNALYFSREAIPTRCKNCNKITMYKQVCVIPFRRNFLFEFSALKPTPLEIVESIDMLRVLEHGQKVRMVLSPVENTFSVDTSEDLLEVEKLMKNDPLIVKYKKY